mmetsp:Transcript_62610/g.71832  ORF Transcript_62610/g.71832 Transcript_62610/m.71832 type:complete len:339 (+) Transcript_62610:96-1112(+)
MLSHYLKLFLVISLIASTNLTPLQNHHLTKLNRQSATALVAKPKGDGVVVQLMQSDSPTLTVERNADGTFMLSVGDHYHQTLDFSSVKGSYSLSKAQDKVSQLLESSGVNQGNKQLRSLLRPGQSVLMENADLQFWILLALMITAIVVIILVLDGALKGVKDELSSANQALQDKIDTQTSKIESLSTKNDELQTKIDTQTTDIASLSTKNDELQTKIDTQSTTIQTLSDKIDALSCGTPPCLLQSDSFAIKNKEGNFEVQASGSNLSLVDASASKAEKWTIEPTGGNFFNIKSNNGWDLSCAGQKSLQNDGKVSVQCADPSQEVLKDGLLEINAQTSH